MRRRPWLVVTGWVVVALGVAPFAVYFYSPLGAGDRVTVVSSVGGALVLAGLLEHLRRRSSAAAAVVLAVVVVPAAVVGLERADRWDRAGEDADRILEAIQERWPEPPDDKIVIGPEPIVEGNIAAFLDQSNIDTAVALVYDDRSVRGAITFSQERFEEFAPEQRLDIRPFSTLDPEAGAVG